MLKVKEFEFREKFTEINFRQRMYQNESFITLMITTEFFPSLVGDNLISGVIEVKLDVNGIYSLDDLINKNYNGDIGSLTVSVNNDGIWEQQSVDSFEFTINNRNGRDLEFRLKSDICEVNTVGVMVSLYSTSSSKEELEKNFNLNDFYDNPVIKMVSNKEIRKYFVRG